MAGTIGQLVADVPRELSLTPPQETKKKTVPQDLIQLASNPITGNDPEPVPRTSYHRKVFT
jgi:hypothetical protein